MHPSRVASITLAVLVVAGCGGPTAPGPAVPTPTPTPDPMIPILISPAEGATLDNACTFPPNTDSMIWDFEWSAVPGASRYHLRVEHPSAAFPVIDVATTATTYREVRMGYTGNLTGWQWKVQAEVNGAFGPYSPVRSFNVERVNTDCP